MSAGAINRRFVIYAQQRIGDGAGGFSEAWSEWGTRWAMLRPLNGRERREAMAKNLEIVGRVKMRYREDLPIPARFEYRGRVLASVGPWIEVDDGRVWVEYDVEESQVPELFVPEPPED